MMENACQLPVTCKVVFVVGVSSAFLARATVAGWYQCHKRLAYIPGMVQSTLRSRYGSGEVGLVWWYDTATAYFVRKSFGYELFLVFKTRAGRFFTTKPRISFSFWSDPTPTSTISMLLLVACAQQFAHISRWTGPSTAQTVDNQGNK